MSTEKTLQEWTKLAKQWRDSGASAAAWCREHKLVYHQFLYWRDRIDRESQNFFIELSNRKERSGIAIDLKAMEIRLSTEFDLSSLKRLLQVLRSC